MAEGGVSQGALEIALASLEDAARRQDVAALLARDSEQLLCASPAHSPSDLWQERSSDVWELARLRMRAETLAADNEQLRGQVLQLSARVDKLTSDAQVRGPSLSTCHTGDNMLCLCLWQLPMQPF